MPSGGIRHQDLVGDQKIEDGPMLAPLVAADHLEDQAAVLGDQHRQQEAGAGDEAVEAAADPRLRLVAKEEEGGEDDDGG